MTLFFENVYINNTSTISGPYEKNGPLREYFDKSYDDLYIGEDSWEKAEVQLVRDCFSTLLHKIKKRREDIELTIGGDLLNQITASVYGSSGVGNGFIGIYGACSTSVLGLIIASSMIDAGQVGNAICFTSSHNMSSEKQFRYPTEYGSLRPNSSTFTATGSAACFLSSQESSVRVECATLGRIVDFEQNDPNDMGRVMAPSAIDTLTRHFEDTGRSAEDYDLILTGDLGKYGLEIVKDYMVEQYQIELDHYNDCGVMLYDLEKQIDIKAGGSGPVCSALVIYSYIYSLLKEGKIKRVLFLATGALFSPTMIYQKQNIPSICHAISLEANSCI